MKTALKINVLALVIIFIFLVGTGWTETLKKLKPISPIQIKPSQSIQVNKSRGYLFKLYFDSNIHNTFYCGCTFDSEHHINKEECSLDLHQVKNANEAMLTWDRVVPVTAFGPRLDCWKSENQLCENSGLKKASRGWACCRMVSEKFNKMESDMHNLVPVVRKLKKVRFYRRHGLVFGEMRMHGGCDIEFGGKAMEPKESIRGDIARIHFYMSFLYKIPLGKSQEQMLRNWNRTDPPDEWEIGRNSLVEKVQGNRNPFVDQPDLVDRIPSFR
jgi:deoxyribonuclease I